MMNAQEGPRGPGGWAMSIVNETALVRVGWVGSNPLVTALDAGKTGQLKKGMLWRETGRPWQGHALKSSQRPCPVNDVVRS